MSERAILGISCLCDVTLIQEWKKCETERLKQAQLIIRSFGHVQHEQEMRRSRVHL